MKLNEEQQNAIFNYRDAIWQISNEWDKDESFDNFVYEVLEIMPTHSFYEEAVRINHEMKERGFVRKSPAGCRWF